MRWIRRLRRLGRWIAVGLLAAGCGGETEPVRYDLTGTWFRAAGPFESGRCFPFDLRSNEVARNSWLVTRSSSGVVGTDDGGCTLSLRENAGVLVGDGESCELADDGPLAGVGVRERRYVRFRLDPIKKTFAAAIVDRYEPSPEAVILGCGLIEATVEGRSP